MSIKQSPSRCPSCGYQQGAGHTVGCRVYGMEKTIEILNRKRLEFLSKREKGK